MQLSKVPMYLRDLRFKTEKSDGDEIRIVIAAMRLEPFTPELCDILAPKVRAKIFSKDGNPTEDVLGLTASIHSGEMLASLRMAVDAKPSMKLEYVRADPKLVIRRDKETPVYSATLKLSFAYPEAKHLLALAHALNTQFWVSLDDMQPALEEDDDEPGDEQISGVLSPLQ